jgi:hypothetical protein
MLTGGSGLNLERDAINPCNVLDAGSGSLRELWSAHNGQSIFRVIRETGRCRTGTSGAVFQVPTVRRVQPDARDQMLATRFATFGELVESLL